jgi:hypothetical protein
VIRQAISCDICGTEKKQTNHWFVAYDQGGELRVSGWSSRNRLRPGAKHLCGQTCLHKLVDDFMAQALAVRTPSTAQNGAEAEPQEQMARSGSGPAAIETTKAVKTRAIESRGLETGATGVRTASAWEAGRRAASATDTSLTSDAAYEGYAASDEFESSARLIPTPAPAVSARSPLRMPMELIAAPAKTRSEEVAACPVEAALPAIGEPPRYASRNWRAAAWERERERETSAGERRPVLAARRRTS